jgi:F0F1-type ATP synthase membrane subunit b/b'
MNAALAFLGKYWKGITIAILLFVVSFFWWQDHRGLVSAYDASVESYETRIKELKESYQRETERKEAALEEYQEKIFILESQYMDFKEGLAQAKEEKVGEYVVLRRDNPEQLIKEIKSRFRFEYVE